MGLFAPFDPDQQREKRLKPGSLLLFLLLTAMVPYSAAQSSVPGAPAANPARPTVATPATLTPVGYLQFESGFLGATHSSEFSSRYSMNEVVKLSVASRLELVGQMEPVAHSTLNGITANNAWDLYMGAQAVLHQGVGARPTIAASYFYHVFDDGASNLDIESPTHQVALLASADVKGFHYDANVFLTELEQGPIRRSQFGQTISIAHPITQKFALAGELWHFTQPFQRSNAIGTLWALSYAPRNTVVFDVGFNRGLTGTSTRWEVFVGFTYLLPHRLWKSR